MLGWAAPPPDTGGPDTRYDIYIQNISNYGITYWESPYNDPYAQGYTSYFFLKNTMSWDDLCTTTAHEFNHACQARYSYQYLWWYENVATWMEDICYDHVNWYISCLYSSPNPLADPHLAITNTTNSYEYAGYLWARFLHEYYGTTCMRLIWERIGLTGGYTSIDATGWVLQHYDSDLKTALGNYAVWRYFTGDRADTAGHFSESHLWPTSYVDPNHQHNGPASGNQGSHTIDGPGGASYIEFYTTSEYLLKSSFLGSSTAGWRVWHIGYGPVDDNTQYMMDSVDYWSVLSTTWHDTTVMVPVANTHIPGFPYDYVVTGISTVPPPPQDPELEICSILSPSDTVSAYSNVTPRAVRRNNAATTSVDTAWVSMYVSDCYSDSREIWQLDPGQTDTVSFEDWTATGCNAIDVRCIGGGVYDEYLANNCCDTFAFIPWSDVDVLEILAPCGVIAQNVTVQPRVLLQNNGTSGVTVSASFTIEGYVDTNSIYIDPDASAELSFENWTPTQASMCTTKCVILTPDQRPCNDTLAGEVLVTFEGVEENQISALSVFLMDASPNPFHQKISIRYQIPNNKDAQLEIYDVTGRLVQSFSLPAACSQLPTVVFWDGTDQNDNLLCSGIYFLRLQAGEQTITKKLLLIR
ncbi:MAG: T9SS type A sorting domain-containing protein [candidate division WOR-3 bacterium]|nr:MAG: T9SS type A sorting domain-containing protein [candidate division WOR-3 bacterium]